MAIQGLTEADKLAIQKASETAGLTAQDKSAFQSLTTPYTTSGMGGTFPSTAVGGAITPAQMSPAPAYPVTTPVDTGIPDTSSVSTTTANSEKIINDLYGTPLPNESQQNDLRTQIMSLTGDVSQEASRRAQLEADPALQAKRQQVQDLTSQANALIAESKAIAPTVKQQNLLDYSGRGIASGIVESKGQREIRQRQLDNAIQALSVGSLLSAAQGNLTLALDQVDRAVKAEFEPKKAELAAKRANLEMLMNDPALTREEKRRGAIAEARLKAEEDKVKKEEEDKKTIQGLALQAQQNGAPTPILRALINSKNLEEALVAGAGWTAKETAQSIQEYNFAVKNGYKGSYTQYQNEDANRKIAIAKAGQINGEFGLSSSQATLFNNIVTKYNASPLIAAADRTIVLKNSIEQARKNPSDGATQLNLIYSYVQALDTYQSAVREGELGLVNSIDSKVGKLSNYVQQVQNGQIIRPEVAKEIADAADNLVNTINQGAKAKSKSYESQADTLGLGAPWRKYQSGFQASFADKTPQQKVEQAVQSSGKTYQQIISGAPVGQIAVVQDGIAGYIPVNEFDPSKQVKM